jgi:hypothetical protein
MRRTPLIGFLVVTVAGLALVACAPPRALPPIVPFELERVSPPEEPRQSTEVVEETEAIALEEEMPLAEEEQPPCQQEDVLGGANLHERRFRSYGPRLTRWQTLEQHMTALGLAERPAGWRRCLDEVRYLQQGYDVWLREGEGQQEGYELSLDPGHLLQRDFVYLESGCEGVFNLGSETLAGWLGRFSASIDESSLAATMKDSALVDEMAAHARAFYDDLPASQQLPESRRQFGLALLRNGHFNAASNVLTKVETGCRWTAEEADLQQLAADLLLAQGRVAAARQRYQILSGFFRGLHSTDRWVSGQLNLLESTEVRTAGFPAYLKALRSYLLFDGEQIPNELRQGVWHLEDTAPESMLARSGHRMLELAEDRVRDTVEHQLREADALVDRRDFARARVILEALEGRDDLDTSTQLIVEDALAKVRLVESLDHETQRMVQEQERAIQWENGLNLLDLHQFDEAIAVFGTLQGSSYEEQAREKIVEASNQAAKQLRRQASALFVQARGANLPDRKKALLLESWQLLKGIETRYPGATILEKVRQNTVYLEDYIRQVDPSMLEITEQSEEPLPEDALMDIEEEILR